MMPLEYWLLLIAFVGIVIALAKPVGLHLAGLLDGSSRLVLGGKKIENRVLGMIGASTGTSADDEMGGKEYALAVLFFSIVGVILTYALQRLQLWLPFNPQA
ncbi:MAG: potassium-transporting ATPase subunit KdpA, partial [Usitatibacteraceae bacterium]